MSETLSAAEEAREITDILLKLPADILAANLALLMETKLLHLVQGKLRDLAQQTAGSFQERVTETATRLSRQPPEELALQLLLAFNKALGLAPRQYVCPRDLEDNTADILARALEAVRAEDASFRGTSFGELFRYQSALVAAESGRDFESLSPEEQDFLVEAPPPEQRRLLGQTLRAEEEGEQYLRSLSQKGAAGAGFAALVGAGGFASYTTATSLLAGGAKLVGLTLPFGAYLHLTSFIAVFANPVFLLAALGGGGTWLYGKQNGKLQRRLVPLLLVQLVAASAAGLPAEGGRGEKLLRLWEGIWQEVVRARAAHDHAATRCREARTAWQSLQQEVSLAQKSSARLEEEQRDLREKLAALLLQQPAALGEAGGALASLGRAIRAKQQELARLDTAAPAAGLLGKLKATMKQAWQRHGLQQELQRLGAAGAQQLEASSPGEAQRLPALLAGPLRHLAAAAAQLKSQQQQLATLAQQEGAARASWQRQQQEESAKAQIKAAAEQRCWGLEQLA